MRQSACRRCSENSKNASSAMIKLSACSVYLHVCHFIFSSVLSAKRPCSMTGAAQLELNRNRHPSNHVLSLFSWQRQRKHCTNVHGKEWVSWSSNETAKKENPVAPRWLLFPLLPSSHPSRLATGLFFYVLSPLPLAGWHIRVTNVSLSVWGGMVKLSHQTVRYTLTHTKDVIQGVL